MKEKFSGHIVTSFDDTEFSKPRVYIEDNLLDGKINRWYDNQGIGKLKYKSKAWDFICRKRNRFMSKVIRKALSLPDDVKIKFSHKAGCPCGCSPGFILSDKVNNGICQSYWINPTPSGEELNEFDLFMNEAHDMLEKEVNATA